MNKSVLFPITFYLEDDDHKAVDSNGETISFTCQLVSKKLFILIKKLRDNSLLEFGMKQRLFNFQ